MGKQVSLSVIRRLPRYYRFLGELLKNGSHRISSRELSARMGLTASQIRQDLNCFGGFGQQGYGYNVEALHGEIGHILGVDRNYKTIVIGMGNLGRAIVNHMVFASKGFELAALFDNNEQVVGESVRGLPVRDMATLERYCHENKPDIAVLCVPRASAAAMADKLIAFGVRGFWNFSHYDIALEHPTVAVENVHLSDSLMTLCYKFKDLEVPEE